MKAMLRLSLFFVWVCAVSFLVTRHVVWRDEVRAMSLALEASTFGSILEGMGDGHPPLWYLLIRAAHVLIPRPDVLQILAAVIGLASMTLFVFRSGFGLFLTGLVLFSRFAMYEYTVVARNYGISMLVLFLLAMLYSQWRHRGVVLGLLLCLLANCNVHSILLAGAFMAFWLGDILLEKDADRRGALRVFGINASIATVGIGYAIFSVSHTLNDAIPMLQADQPTAARIVRAIVFPAIAFRQILILPVPWSSPLVNLAMSAVLYGSILGLIHRRAAMAAAALALAALSLFFELIYPGGYRHEALWLVFLLCLYWIAGQSGDGNRDGDRRPVARAGAAALIAILALQVWAGGRSVTQAAAGRYESQSWELADLIDRTPALHDAIILADPDYMVEPLSYYVSNRTYLPREQRYGDVTWFTRHARLSLSLADILDDAASLHSTTGHPVIILLGHQLDPSSPATAVKESYAWELTMTPEQVDRFLLSTRPIQRRASGVRSDEAYDAYLYDPPS